MTMKPATGIVATTAGRITSAAGAAIALMLVTALPVVAEQGWADSPDFPVSTIPSLR